MPYEWESDIEMGLRTVAEKCPLWLKTLGEIFEGDIEKTHLLQEFFGYCLTRDVRHEKALLLMGESRTGKSTILETFSAVVGKHNFSSVPLEHIENPQYTPLLANRLINFDTDISSQAEKYESSFRKITSGEEINCNPKYVAPYTFKPYCKLIMAANEFPRIKDHSSAFYKRLLVLPCDRVFEDHEQDIRLKDKLQSELFGIFMWAVEGLQMLNNRGGFEKKNFMNEAVEELRLESNPVEIFFEEQLEGYVDDNIYIEKGELYERYKTWAYNGQHYVLNSARFSQAVQRKFNKFTPKNTKFSGKRVWRNLRYKDSVVALPQENLTWQE
jgi:putative DNA primase/helicase